MWPFKSKPNAGTVKFSPTPEMIKEAKANPNGWVYQIAGNYGPNDRVPPEAIIGAYRVNQDGEFSGEFKPNPNYRGKEL